MQPTPLPYYMQVIQAIGPTAIAVAALIITGYFAFWQWKTSNDKLKMDLYEKRFAIYEATMSVLGKALTHGDCTNEDISEYVRRTKGIEFLFDKEIVEYEAEIRQKLNALRYLEQDVSRCVQDEARGRAIASSRAVKNFIEQHYMHEARKKFEPYLSFAHLK